MQNGWTLVPPEEIAGDPWRYRDYIQHSAAELMVAKNMYVETSSGWISDRSIAFLASGRPVLMEDTGLQEHLRVDAGLVCFSDAENAIAAVEAVESDYPRHVRAARELVDAHFASERVLPWMLERCA